MKRTSRYFSFLTSIFVLISVNCTKKKSNSSIEAYNGEKVALDLALFTPLDKSTQNILSDFNKKFPNITVNIRSQGFNEHHSQLQTSLAAGQSIPDVAFVEIDYVGAMGGGGGFSNLLDAPYEAGQYKPKFAAAAWNRGMTSEKELVAIPIDVAPGTAYYQMDLMQQAKMQPEDIKSMDDLFELGKRVTRDLNGDGINDQFLMASVDDVFRMIAGSDDYYYFDEQGKPQLDRQRLQTALTWVKKFYDAGMVANISPWTQEWFASFQKGSCAFQFSGAWLAGYLKDWIAPKQAGKFRVAALPSLEKDGQPMRAIRGGSFAAIPTGAKNKAAAWEFIKFYTMEYNVQLANYRKIDAFPALVSTWDDPMFEEKDEYLGGQQARKLWRDLIKVAPNQFVNPNDRLASSMIESAIAKVTIDHVPVQTALKDAQVELTKRVQM